MAAKSKPSKRQKVSSRDVKRLLDDEASEDNEDD